MPYQTFPLSFSAGQRDKDDPFQIVPPGLTKLENGIMLRTGEISKRWGYAALPTNIMGSSSTITSGVALATLNNQLLMYDGLNMYSCLPSQSSFVNKGTAVSVIQTNTQIVRNNNQQLSPDFASLDGIDVYAWEDSTGGILYSVVDSASGTIIVNEQSLYTGAPSTLVRPKCMPFAAAGVIVIFFINTATNTLNYVKINPSKSAQVNTVPFTLVNGLANPGYYDVAPQTTGTTSALQLAVVWQVANNPLAPGRPGILVGLLGAAFSFFGPISVEAQTTLPIGCINVCCDGYNFVYVSFAASSTVGSNGTTIGTNVFTGGLSTIGGTTTFAPSGVGTVQSIAGVSTASGKINLYAEYQGNTSLQDGYALIYQNTLAINGTTVNAGVTAGTASVFKRSVGLASKPFLYNSRVYVNVAYQSNLQSTYFTLDQNGTEVGKVHQGLGGGLVNESDYFLPECQQVSTGIFKYANLVKGLPDSELGVILALLGVNATTLDFYDTDQFHSVQMAGSLYTVGGILTRYDGANLYEHNYNVYPEWAQTSSSGSGGALGTGSYQYLITYLSADNVGFPDESDPCPAITVVFASGTSNKVQLVIPTLRLTRKQNVQIVVYRTTANGTLFYRVTSAILPLYNNPAVDTVTFTDVYSDTTIQSNTLCYTQPNTTGANPVLTNDSPPSCSLICTYAQRIFVAGLDDAKQIAFTNALTANLPMQFSDLLTLEIPDNSGAITAIRELQGCLIVFTQNAIYYIQGQGPDATGSNNDLLNFTRIPTNVGCVSENSIVETPLGLLFQASHSNGIYLLDRTFTVSYKGAPISGFNNLAITSGNLVGNQWAVFTTNDSSSTALVYDYFYDQWGSFTNHGGLDAVNWLGNSNLYCYLRPNGQVYVQTPTAYSDNGYTYALKVITAWINPQMIQGYQRVKYAHILGHGYAAHNLLVSVGFDFDGSFTGYAPINVSNALGNPALYGATSPYGSDPYYGGAATGQAVYQFRLDVLKKCQSVRFLLTDQEVNPGNQAFSISALTLTLMTKGGANRLPASKQFGV